MLLQKLKIGEEKGGEAPETLKTLTGPNLGNFYDHLPGH